MANILRRIHNFIFGSIRMSPLWWHIINNPTNKEVYIANIYFQTTRLPIIDILRYDVYSVDKFGDDAYLLSIPPYKLEEIKNDKLNEPLIHTRSGFSTFNIKIISPDLYIIYGTALTEFKKEILKCMNKIYQNTRKEKIIEYRAYNQFKDELYKKVYKQKILKKL